MLVVAAVDVTCFMYQDQDPVSIISNGCAARDYGLERCGWFEIYANKPSDLPLLDSACAMSAVLEYTRTESG
jgi:hypothetical protein